MNEQDRPGVRPKEELWAYCLKLAEKHKLTPLEVFNRLVWIGEHVAIIEEEGGDVFATLDGRKIEVRAFGKKES